MTHPFGSIKHLATDALKTGVTLPARMAARAYGVAKGAASAGAGVVRPSRQSSTSTWDRATATKPTPVNVVEELGLDPAPVDTPESAEPITSIDAQADPQHVEATPADVAERLSRQDGQ